jgi:hypothetical protein
MPLQNSGPIALSQIQTEFGGANPINLSEYYRNAGRVDRTVTKIPTTGVLSTSLFYGTTNAVGLSIVAQRGGESPGSGRVVMPTGILSNDIILVGFKSNSSSQSPGSGFTTISRAGNTNGIFTDSGTILSYKIANGSESGTTISGWSSARDGMYAVYVVRPTRVIRTIRSVNTGAYAGTSNAPAYTITTGSAAANESTMALSVMGSWGTSIKGTFSPTPASQEHAQSGSDPDRIRLYLYLQNPALVNPVNCSTDFNNGNVNSYSTGYVAVT